MRDQKRANNSVAWALADQLDNVANLLVRGVDSQPDCCESGVKRSPCLHAGPVFQHRG
jgi:hypothetical protein